MISHIGRLVRRPPQSKAQKTGKFDRAERLTDRTDLPWLLRHDLFRAALQRCKIEIPQIKPVRAEAPQRRIVVLGESPGFVPVDEGT